MDAQRTLSNISLAIVTVMIISVVGMTIFVQCSKAIPESERKTIVTIIEDAGEEILDEAVEHFIGIDPEIDINGNGK